MDTLDVPVCVLTQLHNQGIRTPWRWSDDRWHVNEDFVYGFPKTRQVVFWGTFVKGRRVFLVPPEVQLHYYQQYKFLRDLPLHLKTAYFLPIEEHSHLPGYDFSLLDQKAPATSVDDLTMTGVKQITDLRLFPVDIFPKFLSEHGNMPFVVPEPPTVVPDPPLLSPQFMAKVKESASLTSEFLVRPSSTVTENHEELLVTLYTNLLDVETKGKRLLNIYDESMEEQICSSLKNTTAVFFKVDDPPRTRRRERNWPLTHPPNFSSPDIAVASNQSTSGTPMMMSTSRDEKGGSMSSYTGRHVGPSNSGTGSKISNIRTVLASRPVKALSSTIAGNSKDSESGGRGAPPLLAQTLRTQCGSNSETVQSDNLPVQSTVIENRMMASGLIGSNDPSSVAPIEVQKKQSDMSSTTGQSKNLPIQTITTKSSGSGGSDAPPSIASSDVQGQAAMISGAGKSRAVSVKTANVSRFSEHGLTGYSDTPRSGSTPEMPRCRPTNPAVLRSETDSAQSLTAGLGSKSSDVAPHAHTASQAPTSRPTDFTPVKKGATPRTLTVQEIASLKGFRPVTVHTQVVALETPLSPKAPKLPSTAEKKKREQVSIEHRRLKKELEDKRKEKEDEDVLNAAIERNRILENYKDQIRKKIAVYIEKERVIREEYRRGQTIPEDACSVQRELLKFTEHHCNFFTARKLVAQNLLGKRLESARLDGCHLKIVIFTVLQKFYSNQVILEDLVYLHSKNREEPKLFNDIEKEYIKFVQKLGGIWSDELEMDPEKSEDGVQAGAEDEHSDEVEESANEVLPNALGITDADEEALRNAINTYVSRQRVIRSLPESYLPPGGYSTLQTIMNQKWRTRGGWMSSEDSEAFRKEYFETLTRNQLSMLHLLDTYDQNAHMLAFSMIREFSSIEQQFDAVVLHELTSEALAANDNHYARQIERAYIELVFPDLEIEVDSS